MNGRDSQNFHGSLGRFCIYFRIVILVFLATCIASVVHWIGDFVFLGKATEVSWLTYAISALFLIKFFLAV